MSLSTTTVDPTPVVAMQVYLDNSLVYEVSGTGVQTTLPLTTGAHWIAVQAWNEAGATYKGGFTVNLVPVPITISSPHPSTTVASPVPIKASAPSSSPVQTIQIYVDNAMVYQVSGQTVSTSLPRPSGQQYIVVKGWDGSGKNGPRRNMSSYPGSRDFQHSRDLASNAEAFGKTDPPETSAVLSFLLQLDRRELQNPAASCRGLTAPQATCML
jgi:hypothetical protein